MPHQCTYCSKIFPDAAEELLKGCQCGSRFFYYIKQEKYEELKREVKDVMIELEKADKVQIEKDIRELTGLEDKPDQPVILDLESIKVIKPGKFEFDIVNLFSRQRPIIYKLGEGKYIIDLASSLKGKVKLRDIHLGTSLEENDIIEVDKDIDEEKEEDEIDIELDDENSEEILDSTKSNENDQKDIDEEKEIL